MAEATPKLKVSGEIFLLRRGLTDFMRGLRTITPEEWAVLDKQLARIAANAVRQEHRMFQLDWEAQRGKAERVEEIVTEEAARPDGKVRRLHYDEVPFSDGWSS